MTRMEREMQPYLGTPRKKAIMLNLIWVIAVVLVVLWAVGLATTTTMGGLIHVLLVLAVIAVLARIIMGRRVV
jgi:hypothetical protein